MNGANEQHELIFGLHEDGIKESFKAETFDLVLPAFDSFDKLDRSVCGVSRHYLGAFKNIAPIITYGITIKGLPSEPLGMYVDSSDLRLHPDRQNKIALYKQRKVNAEGQEYFILSIGLSGEVITRDIVGEDLIVDLNKTLNVSIYHNYTDMVNISSGLFISNGGISDLDLAQDALQTSYTFPYFWLRDGKKKPGYEGAAHIAAIYFITTPVDTVMSFKDEDYEFVDWFSLYELQILASTQIALEDIRCDSPEIVYAGCADQKLQDRLGKLWEIPLEPWSLNLCLDGNGELAHMVETLVNNQEAF